MRTRHGLPEIISIGLVAVLFAVLLAQVVLRPFGLGFVWAEEFAAFAFIALVFFSMAAVHGRGQHMTVEAFQAWASPKLSPRKRAWWQVALLLVELLFLTVFAIGLAQMARQTWGSFAGSLSGFRYGWLYLAVLAAALMSHVSVLRQLVAAIRRFREGHAS